MKRIGWLVIAACLVCGPAAAQTNAKVVEQVKATLVANGVDLSGACGAFEITKRVAWQLRGQGFGFLHKSGGNRAVPQADGSCKSGDESSDPEGFATDYLIQIATGYGFDILGDGGGANVPQFDGPETAPDMVARNRDNFRLPFDPDPVPHPTVPAARSPLDRASGVPVSTSAITWAADHADLYDVAFGTTNPPATLVAGLTNASTFVGPLAPGTIYFWRVTARNAVGATVGPVWSFSTEIAAPVPPVEPKPEPVPPVAPTPEPKKLTLKMALLYLFGAIGAIVFCAGGGCR